MSYGGVCLSGESALAAAACEGAGWSLTSDSKGWQCAIPVMRGTLSAGASEGCYLSSIDTVTLPQPQCSEVFGGSFAFPPKPTGTAPRYIFDCGEKMIPESSNLQGETACECAATNAQGQCICGGGRVERNNPEGGTHCVCIRGTAEVGGVCVDREGPIGGVSEGLAAQVTLCTAFGGEVLATEEEGVVGPDNLTGAAKTLYASIDPGDTAGAFYNYYNSYLVPNMQRAILGWVAGDNDWNSYFSAGFTGGGNNPSQLVANIITDTTLRDRCLNSPDYADQPYVECILKTVPQVAPTVRVPYACRGVDKSGTFCLLGSAAVFPCRGLFTRARDCNIKYNRPLLNPFLCAPKCRVTTLTPRGPTCE